MKFAMERGIIVVGLLLAGCQESRFISCRPRSTFVESRSYELHDPFPDESIGPKTFSRPRTFDEPRSDTRKSFDLRNLQASRNLSPGTTVISSQTPPPSVEDDTSLLDGLAPRYNVVRQ